MHMLSKKNLSSGELETRRRSRNPITLGTANGEVQTNAEAQVFVHDPHLFVTVQLLEDTPAVQSSGKLCDEQGYTCEWASGQKHLAQASDFRFVWCTFPCLLCLFMMLVCAGPPWISLAVFVFLVSPAQRVNMPAHTLLSCTRNSSAAHSRI